MPSIAATALATDQNATSVAGTSRRVVTMEYTRAVDGPARPVLAASRVIVRKSRVAVSGRESLERSVTRPSA
ncbi:hypothetical protein C496_10426 [Natronorubrum tibetense GA33]|uniref:Uncharacterized protein n=1 Tax=Natronorubrum tibetense GA33 TaxID=1114856 RepID=L9VVR2_9EURY|nr:hypothetical protein C496_10426 [Natronorubrum tibetense GA33]